MSKRKRRIGFNEVELFILRAAGIIWLLKQIINLLLSRG